ncbi:hypothetical protein J5289_21685 [Rhizobium sp. B230/85]|uniref:DUF7706 family protein n=1 Tax=unclassified Rhizobium TaxID=2613769 RepID=UPI001ADB63F1|nr:MULTISPECIES: hypothetical protein [unclassified Rhizobium]MBO9136900.1 hypothetical protein [Rhizobium sp. B209b/85]QXZ97936.1 hypothetical protein J5289_21685 [Rhizobium sp. B230/85]
MEKIQIELDDIQALALANFCKRAFIERVQPFSQSENEAWQMVYAIDALRFALEKAGWFPR